MLFSEASTGTEVNIRLSNALVSKLLSSLSVVAELGKTDIMNK